MMEGLPQKGFGITAVIIVIAAAALLGGGWWYVRTIRPAEAPHSPVVCTQDVTQCPDGSYVSRTGPNCEFAACPAIKKDEIDTSNWKTYRNEEYGFELRYPAIFAFSENNIEIDKAKTARTFNIIDGRCVISLSLAGGRGLGEEWIYEDASLTLDEKTFDTRTFYYLDKTHLRWISIYGFPTSEFELQLRASKEIEHDVPVSCVTEFYDILSTVKWMK